MLSDLAAALSRLPLKVHYRIADYILYPLIYHVVRYRRTIVRKNLRNAFPGKTEGERKAIEKAFYRQFCHTMAEIVYGYGMSDEQMRERVVFEGMDHVNALIDAAGGGIFMLAHLGNWEWMASIQQWFSPGVTEISVYRRLKSRAMDRLLLAIRGKHSGVCVEKQRILREMVRFRSEGKTVAVGLLSDQKPRPEVTRTWITFLHQETGFLDGGEVLSKKFGYPVFYVHITCAERGYYRVQMKTISTTPQQTEEGEITRTYAQMLEQNILEQPQLWLWSHNRWKWKRV